MGGSKQHRREQAVAALLLAPTVEAAAEKSGVSYRTLKNWLVEPDFRRQYREARRQLVEGALGRLQQAASQAVDTLVGLLGCGHAPTRARAALGILEHAARAVQLADLTERVEALERRDGPSSGRAAS